MLIPTAASMALPAVRTLSECADYAKVAEPFLPQLYELPQQILAHIGDPTALKHLYASTNPAVSGLAFAIALFPVFLIVSEINKNYSQVDRVWSILPSIFHVHYAVWARINGLPTQRIDNVLVFSLIWTTRLTYNYWRRGGYQVGSEDYRWELVKNKIGNLAFFLLNVFFISSLQAVLLFLVTTPSYLLLLTSLVEPKMSLAEIVIARLFLGLIAFEYVADQQQWNYHQAKASYQKTAKAPQGYMRAQLERGFNTTGLFRFSRHPNFAAEQTIWVLLYAWSCWTTGSYYNWTLVGALSYLGVFAGSTPLTEGISASKYPEYSVYQKRVGRFLPKIFGKGWDEREMEKLGPKITEEARRKNK